MVGAPACDPGRSPLTPASPCFDGKPPGPKREWHAKRAGVLAQAMRVRAAAPGVRAVPAANTRAVAQSIRFAPGVALSPGRGSQPRHCHGAAGTRTHDAPKRWLCPGWQFVRKKNFADEGVIAPIKVESPAVGIQPVWFLYKIPHSNRSNNTRLRRQAEWRLQVWASRTGTRVAARLHVGAFT